MLFYFTISQFHITILSSFDADANSLPLSWTESRLIQSECPAVRVWRQNPVYVSQNLIDSSREQDSKYSPYGKYASPETSCSCPLRVLVTLNVSRLHNIIVRSVEHEARTCPLGLNARKLTMPECYFKVRSCSPYSTSHNRILASSLALATMLYRGWATTLVILARCPCKLYFSGSLGRPSPICLLANGPARSLKPSLSHRSHPPYSLSCLFNFSNAMFSIFNFASPFHFLSNTSVFTTEVAGLFDIATLASSWNFLAVSANWCLIKYSRIA